MSPLETIQKSYLSRGLAEDALPTLAAIASVRTYEDGEKIIQQFDHESDLMILGAGKADIVSVIGEKVASIEPGVPFGEMSLIDEQPRSATVVSVGRTEVIVIPLESLRELFQRRQDIGYGMMLNISRVLCERLRATNRQLAAFMALEDVW